MSIDAVPRGFFCSSLETGKNRSRNRLVFSFVPGLPDFMALSVMVPALPWLVVAQDQRVPASFKGFFWQALPRAEG